MKDVETPKASPNRYRVPAVARACAILELLAAARDPRRVTAIASELGIPKSSCFTILSTLEETGFAHRDETDRWSLTLRIFELGMEFARGIDVFAGAQPILENLRDETGYTSHLGVPDDEGLVYVLKADRPGLIRFETYPGKRASLHLTALARVVLAHVDEPTRDRMLTGYRFEGGTSRSVKSRAELEASLEDVRQRGYAFENEEEVEGVSCIAAPVRAESGRIVGALGIAGLSSELSKRPLDELVHSVQASARLLSRVVQAKSP